MIYVLIAIGLFCGYLAWQIGQRDRRITELEQHASTVLERFERMADSHRKDVAALHQARMEETADLLQRIQAPEQAAASHGAKDALPDPPPVNLEDDEAMLAAYEERMRNLGVVSG